MPQARLLVDLPDGPWIADVSRDFPDAGFRVLTAVPDECRLRAHQTDCPRDVDDVLAAAITRDREGAREGPFGETNAGRRGRDRSDRSTNAPAASGRREALASGSRCRTSTNGVAEVDVTGEHERVAALGKRFDEMGLEYELDRVRQRVDPVRLLTDRQQSSCSRPWSWGTTTCRAGSP